MKQRIDLFILSESMKENKYLYFGYLLVIGIVFYLMNVFTPFFCDDWHYNFIYGTHTQIKTLGDVLYSQYLHYFSMNGRFVPHFFVQLFDGILGKGLFNVVNTFMFMAFIYLISYTLRREYKSFYVSSSLALFLIFFFIPAFNNCFLWMSGACNYLWVAVLLLSFNIVLEKDIKNKALFPLLFVFGIICGWSNEAIVLGLGFGYFVYFAFHRDKLNNSRVALLLGLYIGILFLAFSPGSIQRFLRHHVSENNVIGIIHNIDNIRILYILLIAVIIGYFWKKDVKLLLKNNQTLLMAIIVTFLFVLSTGISYGHSRFGIEICSLLLFLKLLSFYNLSKIKFFAITSIILQVTTISYALPICFKNYVENLNIVDQVVKTNTGLILTNRIECIPYFKRFLVHVTNSEWSSFEQQFYPTDYISKHFDKKVKLFFFPKTIYDKITQNNGSIYFAESKELGFYCKQIEKEPRKVEYILGKTDYDRIPFYYKPFVNKMERYTASVVPVGIFTTATINGFDYLLIDLNPAIDDRVIDIRVE